MFEIGTTVGDLRVDALQRTTSGGSVYAGSQAGLERPVTVYVADAPADSDAGRRFLSEVTRLAAVEDRHLLPVYEVRTVGGRIIAVGGVVEARLQDVLTEGPLPPERAVAVVEQMAAAVEALETAGVNGVFPTAATVVTSANGEARFAAVEALLEADDTDRPTSTVQQLAGLLAATTGVGALRAVVDRAAQPGGYASARQMIEAARAAVPAPAARRRRAPLVIGVLLAAAAGAVAVALLVSSGDDGPQRAPANAPGARIAAVIDVGGQARSIGVGEGGVWVGRKDGQLVRIDPATDRVVGAPIRFARPPAGKDTNVTVRAGDGAVFAMDFSGIVVRIDPKTSRVTGRAPAGGQILGATVAGRELWVLTGPPTKLVRMDARTLRRIGSPIAAGGISVDVERAGRIAYLAAIQGKFARIDTSTGHVDTFQPAGQAFKIALRDGVLWIADATSGTLLQVDAKSLRPRGETVRDLGHVITATALGDSIWVSATRAADPDTPMQLHRIDAATGRRAGRALALGTGVGWPQAGAGALWISSDRGVIKVLPTTPEPATTPNRPAPPGPKPLLGGPLDRGSYVARLGKSRLSLSVADDGWIAVADDTSIDVSRIKDSTVDMAFMVPDHVFDRGGGLVDPRSPSQVLRTLRANPHLIVGPAMHAAIAGEPAIGASVDLRGAPRSELCNRVCLPVLSLPVGGYAIEKKRRQQIWLLRQDGQVLAVVLSAPSEAKLDLPRRLLDTTRFTP